MKNYRAIDVSYINVEFFSTSRMYIPGKGAVSRHFIAHYYMKNYRAIGVGYLSVEFWLPQCDLD